MFGIVNRGKILRLSLQRVGIRVSVPFNRFVKLFYTGGLTFCQHCMPVSIYTSLQTDAYMSASLKNTSFSASI